MRPQRGRTWDFLRGQGQKRPCPRYSFYFQADFSDQTVVWQEVQSLQMWKVRRTLISQAELELLMWATSMRRY